MDNGVVGQGQYGAVMCSEAVTRAVRAACSTVQVAVKKGHGGGRNRVVRCCCVLYSSNVQYVQQVYRAVRQ